MSHDPRMDDLEPFRPQWVDPAPIPKRWAERSDGPKPFHKGLGVVRAVHFVDDTGLCLAATVSRVLDKANGVVALHVMVPGGMKEEIPVYYSPDNLPGTWHWPEFVD